MKKSFSYPSANGEHEIHAICWQPDDINSIKAVLQIAHGMAEHIERYDEFSRFMTEQGFVVYGNDHAGHGKSLNAQGDLGYFGAGKGRENVVNDLYTLTQIAKTNHPDKPFFLLGHSMGSFLVRSYITRYGSELFGAILVGTNGRNSLIGLAVFLSKLTIKCCGKKSKGTLLNKLAFGNFNRKIKNHKTAFDWLSANAENVQNYLNDPLCGFVFTNSAFLELFSLVRETTGKQWAERVPSTLPVLLVSGANDPVGDYGKGVTETADLLKKAGVKDVSIKLFDNMRHEVLNEKERLNVYHFILDWLNHSI